MNDQAFEFLSWDSDFFGRRIGRIDGGTLDEARVERVFDLAQRERIDCLYFLAEDHAETVRLAESNGFRLVDIRVDYSLAIVGDWEWPHRARLGMSDDRSPLLELAAESYVQSRFFRDPNFDDARCAALYRVWLEKSFEGYADAVIVVDEAAGFATCTLHDDGRRGVIGLVGVAPHAQGQGVGRDAVNAAIAWFAERGAASVEVATQGRNIGAQRLYQGCGFKLSQTRLWYHRWFDPNSQRPATL